MVEQTNKARLLHLAIVIGLCLVLTPSSLAFFWVDLGPWFPHAGCLHWQPWLLVPWLYFSIHISVSYLRIPVRLREIRTIYSSKLTSDAVDNITAFEKFIWFCGSGHFLRAFLPWMPFLTPLVILADIATSDSSHRAVKSLDHALALVNEIREERDNAVKAKEKAEARLQIAMDRLRDG